MATTCPNWSVIIATQSLIPHTNSTTGIPHESVKDDVYEGYFIPAGSVMHPLEWSIGRDPEQFPEPNAFNPLRWLEPKYPTYQEPLSKYPTITQYSQFGYGRRVCTGQGVAEADLFVGIGSMAWMFKMSGEEEEARENPSSPKKQTPASTNEPPTVNAKDTSTSTPSGLQTPPSESEIEAHLFEKFPMSRKNTLLGKPNNKKKQTPPPSTATPPPDCSIKRNKTITHKLRIPGQTLPGQFPAFFAPHTGPDTPPSSPKRIFAQAGTGDMPSVNDAITSEQPSKQDPTLEYSSLLIAKPLPFRFNLQIRDRKKAEFVAREWMNLKMEGELKDSRCYWEGGNAGNQAFGWGEVHK